MWKDTIRRWRGVGRGLQLLCASDVLTVLSLMMGHVAVAWWIAQEGGAHDLVVYGGVMSLTAIIFMPLLSPLIDRYPKRALLGWSLLLIAIEALVLAGLAQYVGYRLLPVLLLEMVAVIALAVAQPVAFSIAADLVPADLLSDGLSLQKVAQTLGRTLGPGLCGLVLAVADIQMALWLHGLLYIAAVWAAFRIPAYQPKAAGQGQSWLGDTLAGLRAKWLIPLERYWMLVALVNILFFLPAVGMMVPLRVQQLGWSGTWLGLCEAALSVGMLLGALWVSRWAGGRFGRYRSAIVFFWGEAIALGAVGWLDSRLALLLCFFITGICLASLQLIGQTHRMLAVPEHFRGRFSSSNLLVMHIAGVAAPALLGGLLIQFEIDRLYLLYGVALMGVALLYPMIPGYREFLTLSHEEVKNWFGRNFPQAFCSMSSPSKPQAHELH